MSELSQHLSQGGPLLLYFLVVVVLVLLILVISHLLGEHHNDQATGEPFESGIAPVGDTYIRFSAPYFLVAVLFVIFDLEAAFIYAWAVTFREVGWAGYLEVLIFIAILAAALVYLWKLGALDWGPKGRAQRRQPPLQGPSAVLSKGAEPPTREPEH